MLARRRQWSKDGSSSWNSRTRRRREAVRHLGHLARPPAAAVRGLCKALKDRDKTVRLEAVQAIQTLGVAIYQETHAPPDALDRKEPPDLKLAVPDLIEVFKADPEREVRLAALSAFGQLGSLADSTAPALVEGLKDTDAPLRRRVAIALGLIGPGAKCAVPALIEALRDPDDAALPLPKVMTVAQCAAQALGSMGSEATAAIPALKEMVGRGEAMDRACAIGALGRVGAKDRTVIALLVRLVDKGDDESGMQLCAIGALGSIGPPARDAIPNILRVLESAPAKAGPKAYRIQMTVFDALGQIGPDEAAVHVLLATIKDRKIDWLTRSRALAALRHVGAAGKEAIPDLNAIIEGSVKNSDSVSLCSEASRALRSIGRDAVSPLVAALSSPDATVRRRLMDTLGDMGPDARDAIPALRKMLNDPESKDDAKRTLPLIEGNF